MAFCGIAEIEPIINIDSFEADKAKREIALQKIYYRPGGYHKNVRKLWEESLSKGYDSWLQNQAIWQVYAPIPNYIPCASFNITVPNKVHQWDLLVIPPEISGYDTYLYVQTVKDIASHYGWGILRTNKNSSQTVEIFEGVYNDPNIALVYPDILMTDMGKEFLGECNKFYTKYKIKHIQTKSKQIMGIIERFNRTLIEKVFPIQYAQEMLLPLSERSRVFSKILRPILIKLNNSPTRLIGMPPSEAIKKKYVYSKPSKPRNGPVGFEEDRLTYSDFVRYLLQPSELEGGLIRRRAGDLIWSPAIYQIDEALVQKNQPVLYKLLDGPDRKFVREELQLIDMEKLQLPPKYILNKKM